MLSEERLAEEGEGVGQLLRSTVDELEVALKDSRQLLTARDEELSKLKLELERYKQQAAREIANKTRLAQALDQSQSHVAQLEEMLQNWQLQVQPGTSFVQGLSNSTCSCRNSRCRGRGCSQYSRPREFATKS